MYNLCYYCKCLGCGWWLLVKLLYIVDWIDIGDVIEMWVKYFVIWFYILFIVKVVCGDYFFVVLGDFFVFFIVRKSRIE